MPSIVGNTEYEWTNDDAIGYLLSSIVIRSDKPETKEEIVADVVHKPIKTKHYTKRV